MGEATFGTSKGSKNVLYATNGTGIGIDFYCER